LPLVLDDLAKGVLDGGVVAFHEMAVHELHSERGFPLSKISKSERERDLAMRGRESHSPTDLLPTIAILRCLDGAGMALTCRSSLGY
jgi:hypothetical protein